MSDTKSRPPSSLLAMTAAIISSHAEANRIDATALPALIQDVYQALVHVDTPPSSAEARKPPAVPIKRSIFPDYIVCLEDGQKLKILKRHRQALRSHPQAYREKWGLPSDYPMVAPAYSQRRSTLAKQFGLGRECSRAVRSMQLPS